MATIYTQAIQELYVAYFNRPADPAGLAFWEGVVAASAGDTAAVSAAFAASAEYKAEYEDLNVTGTLRQIYRNLFNDEADAAGLAFWANAVSTGAVTIDKAVTAIADGAQGVHATTFANKVTVATAFTAALDTDAEKAGYTGDLANDAAKAFLATITTNATVTAALVPATLAASVADVIKAGVVFTLPTALASYAAAVEARDEFLAEADGDDDEDTSIDLEAAQDAIDAKLVGEVDGYLLANSAGVNAALLADEIEERALALVAENKLVVTATANVAKVAGLSGYIANFEAATAADTAADAAAASAQGILDGALVTFNASSAIDIAAINANGTVAGIIELDGSTLVLASGVTETTHKGIGTLLVAIKADVAADKAAVAAQTNLDTATRLLNRTDVEADAADELLAVGTEMGLTVAPTAIQIEAEFLKRAADLKTAQAALAAGTGTQAQVDAAALEVTQLNTVLATLATEDATNPVADAYLQAVADAEFAAEEVAELDAIVDEQAELDAVVAQAESLEDAITAAEELFTSNDFAVPVTLTAFVAGTDAADIFVAGDVNSTVLNFGADDQLFLGAEYTMNKGALTTGNNAVLEVFMSQSGANTVLRLETVAFGSASADAEIVITLTGVNMADVTFENGIISI